MGSREKKTSLPLLSKSARLLLARLLLLSFLITAFYPAELLRCQLKEETGIGYMGFPESLSDDGPEPADENTGEIDLNDIFKITKETDVVRPDYSCRFASLLIINELLFADRPVFLPDWDIRTFSPPPEAM